MERPLFRPADVTPALQSGYIASYAAKTDTIALGDAVLRVAAALLQWRCGP